MEVERKVEEVKKTLENKDSKSDQALFSFGLIGDVQFALDTRYGTNWTKTETRYFWDAINKLKLAVASWNKYPLDFIVNLGDLLDGRNRKAGTLDKAWKQCADELAKLKCKRRFDMVGNHELYCWGCQKNFPKELNVTNDEGRGWYSHQPSKGWRVVILDSFALSAIPGSENEKETLNFLKSKNPNIAGGSSDWRAGLPKEKLHYLPYNGGLGEIQRRWLDEQLGEASRLHERVIIFTHVELVRTRDFQDTLIFDNDELVKILRKYKGVVHTIFTGHHHDGGYIYVESLGVHSYNILCPLIVQEGLACHAVCHVLRDGSIKLEGFGAVKTISLL